MRITFCMRNRNVQELIVALTLAQLTIVLDAQSDRFLCSSPSHSATVFSDVGTTTWTAPLDVTSIGVLVVAGGGGGGAGIDRTSGGGGAGGFICQPSFSVIPGKILNVTIGEGGAGGPYLWNAQVGTKGGDSYFGSLRAFGGGGGGGGALQALSGGSSGGVSHNVDYNIAVPVSGQGNRGGLQGGGTHGGSGGGGAGGVGLSGSSPTCGGAGGIGAQCSIFSESEYFAGGGGGSAQIFNYDVPACVGGSGGLGGGASGARFVDNGESGYKGKDGNNAASNTGGGGGGGAGCYNFNCASCATGNCGNGGSGGSGIVVICVLSSIPTALTLNDTSFYVSGTLSEVTAEFSTVNNPSAISYYTNSTSFPNTAFVLTSGSYLSTPMKSSLPTGSSPFTVSSWVKCDSSVLTYDNPSRVVVSWGDKIVVTSGERLPADTLSVSSVERTNMTATVTTF